MHYLLQVYNFQKLSETAGVGHFIQALATGRVSKEYFLENRKQRGFLRQINNVASLSALVRQVLQSFRKELCVRENVRVRE